MTVDDLACGHVDEQPPEVVSVLQPGKPALAKSLAESEWNALEAMSSSSLTGLGRAARPELRPARSTRRA